MSHTNFTSEQSYEHHHVEPKGDQEEEELITLKALHITNGITFLMVLKSAMELGVLEIISEASDRSAYVSASEVAGKISGCVNPKAPIFLDRMLSLLTSFSILKCKLRRTPKHEEVGEEKVERVYEVASICKYFLRPNKVGLQGSLEPLFLLQHDMVSLECWNHLTEAVLEGGTPFNKAHGMGPFEFMKTDSRVNHLFNQAMSNHTIFAMKRILETYRGFEGINILVDVGGGVGSTLDVIVSQYPQIKGINFDLPHVLADAPITNPGVEHIEGDMFEEVPKGDAIFLKWILHDWGDEDCFKLLKNCWKALPTNGKVIVVESIVPLIPQNDYESKVALEQDSVMMFVHSGGKERRIEEFQALAIKSGFTGCIVICSVYKYHWVMEFHKAN